MCYAVYGSGIVNLIFPSLIERLMNKPEKKVKSSKNSVLFMEKTSPR